jgi:hypothetical protein
MQALDELADGDIEMALLGATGRVLPAPRSAMLARSKASVVLATIHPSPSDPTSWSAGTRARVRNTSSKSASPFIWRRGRVSTPDWSMAITK